MTTDSKVIIVPISDCVDVANNEIRGELYKNFIEDNINLNDVVIEPVAPVEPMSIINAAFIVRLLADAYPGEYKTILYVVVHHLREQPERIVGITKDKKIVFVGRNTGAFYWLAKDLGIDKVYIIPETRYVPFGGKSVYPHYISKIIKYNMDFDLLVNKGILKQTDPSIIRKINIIKGTIVHIDNFGLCKIFEYKDTLYELGYKEGDIIKIKSIKTNRIYYARFIDKLREGDDNEIVIYPGSSLGGLLEIGVVRGEYGCRQLGFRVGDIIEFG